MPRIASFVMEMTPCALKIASARSWPSAPTCTSNTRTGKGKCVISQHNQKLPSTDGPDPLLSALWNVRILHKDCCSVDVYEGQQHPFTNHYRVAGAVVTPSQHRKPIPRPINSLKYTLGMPVHCSVTSIANLAHTNTAVGHAEAGRCIKPRRKTDV